jgi:hypothetical protein
LSLPEPGFAALRHMPYPYRGLFAICSDLDETPDAEVYFLIARFLNTTAHTVMGPGVGLEIGNSIYFDMPPGQFAYWSATDADRGRVREQVQSGHIDCLHSYGDLAVTRAHAGRALDELSRHGCTIPVWVDHAVAPTNFGRDIMRGSGDVPGAQAYHADLTLGAGVRYVWRGRVSSIIGQDAAWSLGGILRKDRLPGSGRTAVKELAKGLLAVTGSEKYGIHAANEVLRRVTLRDGARTWEFLRGNPYWAAVDGGDTATGIADVLTGPMLETLARREGVMILYTHLGKVKSREMPFDEATQAAFRTLASFQESGQVLVTTTRRALDYSALKRGVSFEVAAAGGALVIEVTVPPGLDTDGLTFYVDDPERTEVRIGGQQVAGLLRNPKDHTGRASVSLPWRRLEFPGS